MPVLLDLIFNALFAVFEGTILSGGGQGGAETRENRSGRWAGSGRDGAECGSHVKAGGGRRMRDIKFFDDFLVPI